MRSYQTEGHTYRKTYKESFQSLKRSIHKIFKLTYLGIYVIKHKNTVSDEKWKEFNYSDLRIKPSLIKTFKILKINKRLFIWTKNLSINKLHFRNGSLMFT